MNTITGYIYESAKQAVMIVIVALFLMFGLFIIIGPMFGIAMLVDTYSEWFLLLYIPWVLTLPITCKPLSRMFDAG
jgi:hypothetical protein